MGVIHSDLDQMIFHSNFNLHCLSKDSEIKEKNVRQPFIIFSLRILFLVPLPIFSIGLFAFLMFILLSYVTILDTNPLMYM